MRHMITLITERRPSTGACPACWAMGTKEWKYCTVRNKHFVLGRQEQSRQKKNLLYRHDKPNESTKEGPLSFALFVSPFTSVSTASRGHPSLVSLTIPTFYDSVIFALCVGGMRNW